MVLAITFGTIFLFFFYAEEFLATYQYTIICHIFTASNKENFSFCLSSCFVILYHITVEKYKQTQTIASQLVGKKWRCSIGHWPANCLPHLVIHDCHHLFHYLDFLYLKLGVNYSPIIIIGILTFFFLLQGP